MLYLASHSPSRQQLLRDCKIDFVAVGHSAVEESIERLGKTLKETTQAIARLKIAHVALPESRSVGELCWVLSADTMGTEQDGIVRGKPRDILHARQMLVSARQGTICGTAFCVDRRVWDGNQWVIEESREGYVESQLIFNVPDDKLDEYCSQVAVCSVSGGIAIENYGAQFLISIIGSYTTIVGLPVYEVVHKLYELGWKKITS